MRYSHVFKRLIRLVPVVFLIALMIQTVLPMTGRSRAIAQVSDLPTQNPAANLGSDGTAPPPQPPSPPVAPNKGLAIASWNLAHAAAAGAITRVERKRKTWRNTFVPRNRRETGSAQLAETLRDVDVVLLQGVHNIREARKLFPARYWKLVISRQVLSVARARGRGPYPRTMPEGFATTAIAVRYQLGVRVTGQDHLLDLAKVDESTPVSGASSTDPQAPNTETVPPKPPLIIPAQAGLAVRILYNGKMVWLVSVALGDSCLTNVACASYVTLDNWIENKHDFGDKVIVGGQFHEDNSSSENALRDDPTSAEIQTPTKTKFKSPGSVDQAAQPACKNQDIELDRHLTARVKRIPEAGCIALVTLSE